MSPEQTQDLMTKRRITLFLTCLINICAGINYAWSVFAQPLAERLSQMTGDVVTSGSLAFAFSLACIFSPLSMIVSGSFADRYGPRYILMIAGLFIAIGFIGSALCTSAIGIIICYGFFVGCGLGSAFNTGMGNVLKFFPDRIGVAGGLASTCFGASSVIVPFIAVMLLAYFDIAQTFIILGSTFGLIIVISAYFTTRCPADFQPAGKKSLLTSTIPDRKTTEMVKSKIFYIMFGLAFCGTLPGMMMISQAARIAQYQAGLSATAAALCVSFLAVCNMSGRLIGGYLSDRFGRIQALMVALAAAIFGSVSVNFSSPESPALIYFALFGVGFSFGSMNSIFPGFTTAEFGRRYNTLNYAIMMIALSTPGIIAPMITNYLYGLSNSFGNSFMVATITALVGIGFAATYILMKRKENQSH